MARWDEPERGNPRGDRLAARRALSRRCGLVLSRRGRVADIERGDLGLALAAAAPQAASAVRDRKRRLSVASDQLVTWMLAQNIPITRDTYLALAWGSNFPDPWMPENEAELPSFLREREPASGSGRPAPWAARPVGFHASRGNRPAISGQK
jgi:hypothetical protein